MDSMHQMAMLMASENATEEAAAPTPPPARQRKDTASWRRLSIGESHEHVMLNEILQQPRTVGEVLEGQVSEDCSSVQLEGLTDAMLETLCAARRILICACGTSYHAGLIGEYLMEQLARIPCKAEYGSEFRYKSPNMDKTKDVLIVISQSGETADALAALRSTKKLGVPTIALVNTVDSAIGKEADVTLGLRAGQEIGKVATKTLTAALTTLTLLALQCAAKKGSLEKDVICKYIKSVAALPEKMTSVLKRCNPKVKHACKVYRYAQNFLFLGRGFNFPVALEGALKLKEIAQTHAEGYPAAEMKHGPIALIDAFMPVLFIAPRSDLTYEKVKANISEVLARRGSILVITEEGNDDFKDKAEYVLPIVETEEFLFPILAVLPLQLLAYHIANMRGLDVDKPVGLAKTHSLSPSLTPSAEGDLLPGHVRTTTDLAQLSV